MTTRRQARLLVTLSLVLGAHLVVVWLLVSSPRQLVRGKSGSLQLIWIARTASPETVPDRGTTRQRPKNILPHHQDRTPESLSIAPPSNEESNAIHPAPDWADELKLAAKETLAKELERKKHEFDFAHAYPKQPTKPPQIAWDYAATHRIEALPQGGTLIHLGDNCVLLIAPLPLVFCSIGKLPANGNLFEHIHD